MTASTTAVLGRPSRPGPTWGGVCFDDAALTLAVDDAHDDRPRAGSGELGDHRDAESADLESHGDEEAVELLGKVIVGGRCAENLEPGEGIRVEPCAVPRVQPVGDDVARLTDTFEARHRRQPGIPRPRRRDRRVGRGLAPDGVQPHPAQHAIVIRRERLPRTMPPVRQPQTVPRAHQRSAFDRCGGQVRAQVRTRAGSHQQAAVGAAPRHDLHAGDRGTPGFGGDLRTRGEGVPVAARAALRAGERRPDHRRVGVGIGGRLRRPVRSVAVFGTARLWPL